MSGGILSGILGGAVGGDQAQMGNGILGNMNNYMTNNAGTLLGFGAGMLAGDNALAAQGAMQGMQQDQRTRLLQRKQAEEEQKKVWAQSIAPQIGMKPEDAAMNPEAAESLWRTVQANRLTPKEYGIEETYLRGLQKTSPEQFQQVMNAKLGLTGGDEIAKVRQRQQAATQLGLTPNHPAYQSYILTGKMPREDQAPLTATDKKAILEADEQVLAGETAEKGIAKAQELSPQAYEGKTSGLRTFLGNNLPDLAVPDWIASPEQSKATADMENVVTSNALNQMKAIFGGNPTEGERQILLEIQGSANQPQSVRKEIFTRAEAAIKRRLEFNRQRAEQLRGGTYYGNQGKGAQRQPAPSAQETIQVDGYTIRQR